MSLFSKFDNRIVIVDSQNRIDGTDSDFTFNLKLPSNDYTHVALHQFSCPRSWYDVDIYTNQFTLTEYGFSPVVVNLAVGWYSVYTMVAELTSVLTSASPNGWTYTVTWPGLNVVNTNQFTFTVTKGGSSVNPNTYPPSLSFTSQDCWVQLGFNANSTNTFTASVANTAVLVSVNSINISYINRLYLTSTICTESQNNLLQVVLIAGNYQPGSYVYYEDLLIDANSRQFTRNKDNVFRFTLYDNYGNIILLNGLNLVFSLIFFKKDDINDVHRQHLEIQNLEKLL